MSKRQRHHHKGKRTRKADLARQIEAIVRTHKEKFGQAELDNGLRIYWAKYRCFLWMVDELKMDPEFAYWATREKFDEWMKEENIAIDRLGPLPPPEEWKKHADGFAHYLLLGVSVEDVMNEPVNPKYLR